MAASERADAVTFLPLDGLRQRRSLKWRAYSGDVLPLWVAEMDVELAPPIAEALHAAVARGDTGYSHRGTLPEAYADFSRDRFGWAPEPDLISLAPNVMTGVAEVLRLVTAPGDGVVINPPVYAPFWGFIRHAGRTPVEVPMIADGEGGYALDLDGIERAFASGARAYLLCNPHNPIGGVRAREELEAIADLAARYDVIVLADEVHAPLTYPGVTHIPFGSLDHDAAQRAVMFVSASKGWNLPGLTAALIVAGPHAPPAVRPLPHEVQVTAGMFGVIAAHAALTRGLGWLDALLVALDANRRALADLLRTHLPAVRYRMPDATYLAWLDCRDLGVGDDPADVFLYHGRVALNPGHTFGEPGRGFVRCNFAAAPEVLAEGVRRMVTAVERATH